MTGEGNAFAQPDIDAFYRLAAARRDTRATSSAALIAAFTPDRAAGADPLTMLAEAGGLEHAAIAGYLLGAAALRVPVLLDGVGASAAALAAVAMAPDTAHYLVAGHRSAEPGASSALSALGLRPLLDLELRHGEGAGAALALPLVQAAARILRDGWASQPTA